MNRNKLSRHFQELLQLKVIIEQGSINRAAAIVGLTQSGLTRRVGRLEASLGVKLLNRTARGVFATVYSEAILDNIKLACSELDRAETELETIRRGTSGQLTCGGTLSTINRLFAPSIDLLQSKRPNLKIRVIEGLPSALLAMLRNGDLDIAVCAKTDGLGEPELSGERVGYDHIGIFVGEGSNISSGATTLGELNETAQWILPDWSGSLYRLIVKQFESKKLSISSAAIETNSIPLLKGILRTNPRAVAITTAGVIYEELKRKAIRELRGDWKWPSSQTIIFTRKNVAQNPTARLFAKCIRTTANQLTDRVSNHYY